LIEEGLEKMEQIFSIGKPTLVSVNEFSQDDYVACVSLVGAPSAQDMYIDSEQMIQTVERIRNEFPQPIKALRSEEHTSELQSRFDLVCRLLLEKKKKYNK